MIELLRSALHAAGKTDAEIDARLAARPEIVYVPFPEDYIRAGEMVMAAMKKFSDDDARLAATGEKVRLALLQKPGKCANPNCGRTAPSEGELCERCLAAYDDFLKREDAT